MDGLNSILGTAEIRVIKLWDIFEEIIWKIE